MPRHPTPAATVPLLAARARWHAAQGLDRPVQGDVEATVRATGWIRSLGGVDVYLALRARNPDLTRDEIDASAVAQKVRVLPSLRGCIYLVNRGDAPALLGHAEAIFRKRTDRDLAKLEVPPEEIQRVQDAVREALSAGSMTPAQIKAALPDGVVRALGAPGKKLGMSTTLPTALRYLEFEGRVERALPHGRLDTERYRWQLPTVEPAGHAPEHAERLALIALRFLQHHGPATAKDLAAWAGTSQRDAKAAIAACDAVPVAVEDYADNAWALRGDLEALQNPQASTNSVRLLPMLDSYLSVHEGVRLVTPSAHHGLLVRQWGRTKSVPLREARYLHLRAILRGPELAGFWELDPSSDAVVWGALEATSQDFRDELDAAARSTQRFLTDEVGHGRAFSLDTNPKLTARSNWIRSLAT
jgi:hypothetical protein